MKVLKSGTKTTKKEGKGGRFSKRHGQSRRFKSKHLICKRRPSCNGNQLSLMGGRNVEHTMPQTASKKLSTITSVSPQQTG
eukprot:8750175-Ditylum_brightwellii.AAC.2